MHIETHLCKEKGSSLVVLDTAAELSLNPNSNSIGPMVPAEAPGVAAEAQVQGWPAQCEVRLNVYVVGPC